MDYEPIECKICEAKDEEKLLGSSSPLVTTLRLNIPGFIFSIISAFQDAADLYFIKKGFEQDGVTIVSIASIIRQLIVGFAYFHMQGTCAKFSELIAKKAVCDAGYLYVELVRMCIILGSFSTLVLSLSVPHLLPLMGVPDILVDEANKYLLPICFLPFFILNLTVSASIVLACGRSLAYAAIQIGAIAVSLSADPLFIYVFKAPLSSIGFAFVSGHVTLSIILIVLFSMNKFCVRPDWRCILMKPSSQFWELIKLSIPSTCAITLSSITPVLFSMFLKESADRAGNSTEVCTVFSTTAKVYSMLIIAIQGSTSGVASAASFALHKNIPKRLYKLIQCGHIIPILVVLIVAPLMIFEPSLIIDIWIKDENMKQYTGKIAPIPFYTSILEPFNQIVSPLAIVFGHVWIATVAPCVKAATLVVSSVLFSKFSKMPYLMLYSYTLQDVMNFIASLSVLVYILYDYYKLTHQISPTTSTHCLA